MADELDNGDLDAIREVRAMPGHALVVTRMAEQIAAWKTDLERQAPEAQTNFLRGKIAGMRTAQEIPQILEDEAVANVSISPLIRRYKDAR